MAISPEISAAISAQVKRGRDQAALEIGHVVLDWNDLQEGLGRHFQRIIGGDFHVGMSIWYSQYSDSAQREMLGAAVAKVSMETISSDEASDIKWVLYKARGLAEERNNVTHAHYRDWVSFRPESFLQAATSPSPKGSARTIKLHKDPELAKHFSAKAKVLTHTVAEMHNAIYYGRLDHPWPCRPLLPTRGQSKPARRRDG